MAASRKEYEMLFSLSAQLAGSFKGSFASASKEIGKLQSTMKALNTTSEQIASFEKQAKAVENSKSKIEKLNKEAENLKKSFEKGEISQEDYTEKSQELEKRVGEATNKLSDQQKTLDTTAQKLKDAGVNTENLAEENKKLTKTYDDLRSAQKNLDEIHTAQEANRKAISKTKTELAKTVGVVAGLGAAVYQGAIKPAAEFESQMSAVQAISGAADDDLKKLADKAKEMGGKSGAIRAGEP
jgi:chromosome segregation ATPase